MAARMQAVFRLPSYIEKMPLPEQTTAAASSPNSSWCLQELGEGDLPWRQFGEMAARIHASLDPIATAYQIANEGRTWLGVDRVSVLAGEARRPRLVAMSGVDRVDRRADLVRTMESLVECVAGNGDVLRYEGETLSLPPEIEDRLHQFLEHSPARFLEIVPLTSATQLATVNQPPSAFLLIEHFSQLANLTPLCERLQLLVRQAASAIANARQHARVPWSGWFDRLAFVDRHWLLTRTGMIVAAVAAILLALTIIPADFTMEVRGELQPKARREIFAPVDGVIAKVCVEHGQDIAAGAVLLQLTQSQLDLETARVNGELRTVRKQLAAIRAIRFGSDRSRENSVERAHQLTADEEELKESIKSLEKQQQILDMQRSELTVCSPLTGKVLTWNVEPLLSARPVARGQHLMTVADPAGPWELDLRVPDDRMGHILAAGHDHRQPLGVSFVVATDPGQAYGAKIDRIAQAAESNADQKPTVTLTATIDSQTGLVPRPGAEVIAHIDCGRRSVGYVWFHDLFDAVRSWLWF